MASKDRHGFGAEDSPPAGALVQGASSFAEHPQDVLQQWLAWREHAPTALVVVTATQGGGVRAPGALMALRADAPIAG